MEIQIGKITIVFNATFLPDIIGFLAFLRQNKEDYSIQLVVCIINLHLSVTVRFS